MPVAIPPVHRQLWPMLRQFVLERRDEVTSLLIDRALSIKVVVVLGDRQHSLARNVFAAEHIFEERNHLFPRLRPSEGDNKNGIVDHAFRSESQVIARRRLMWEMVRPERFELPTCCSGGNRSIQLSYGRTDVYSLHGYRNEHQRVTTGATHTKTRNFRSRKSASRSSDHTHPAAFSRTMNRTSGSGARCRR